MTAEYVETALKITGKGVEGILEGILKVPQGPEGRVVEAMRHAMFAGGKRLRPFLVVATADLFEVEKQRSLRVAAAVECLHCYSLIHDDLPSMDNDDMRRGKPTVHKAFDEATAILAGDALSSLAFEILAHEKTHPDPHVRAELVLGLAKASGHHGMVGGQMMDLMAETRDDFSEMDINRLQQMKTGALITFSSEAGAILGKASPALRHSLVGYGRDLGLAFQIADDLLDIDGDPDKVGKAVRKDKDRGKATFVSIMGAERARQQARMLADQAKLHLETFGDRAILLRGLADFAINRRH